MKRPDSGCAALLEAWAEGDAAARDRLWSALYGDLRGLARACLRNERPEHTLQATDLVHETYLRLVDSQCVVARRRRQFLALVARTMRHVLVDHARRKRAKKRGGGLPPIALDELPHLAMADAPEPTALEEALSALAEIDAGLAELVQLRFFGGLTHEELAIQFEISVPTVRRRWRLARAWLLRSLAVGAR